MSDQGYTYLAQGCTQCGIWQGDKRIRPAFVNRGGYWCCPMCSGSYGTVEARAPGAVPEGWKLVPIEATPEMRAACRDARAAMVDADKGQHSAGIWRAMLAAAPPIEAQFEVRIAGPDDVIPFADELAAHRHANAVNATYLADRRKHPDDEVLCVATVHGIKEIDK